MATARPEGRGTDRSQAGKRHHGLPGAEKTCFWRVLHPHDTQHTLAEIVPVLEECGLTIQATSINGFTTITSLDALYRDEQRFLDTGRDALARGEFYPGFFIVMARKDVDGPVGTRQPARRPS